MDNPATDNRPDDCPVKMNQMITCDMKECHVLGCQRRKDIKHIGDDWIADRSAITTEITSQIASLRSTIGEMVEKNITWELLDSGTMETEIRLTQGDYSQDIMTNPDFSDLDQQISEETGVDRERVRDILENHISEDLLHDLRIFSAVEIAMQVLDSEEWGKPQDGDNPDKPEKPEYLKKWERADNYMGEDYSEYYVILGKTRDSYAVDRSNFDSLEKTLKDPDSSSEYKPGVVVARFRHWACGWIEAIMVHESARELLEELNEKIRYIKEDYPILDENLHSEYEVEENTYWCDVCKKDTYHPGADNCDDCEQREMDEARKKEEEARALSCDGCKFYTPGTPDTREVQGDPDDCDHENSEELMKNPDFPKKKCLFFNPNPKE